MTSEQFDKEMKRLRRRLELLRLARSGQADVIKVEVKGHWVRRYRVRNHVRILYRKRAK